MLLIDELLLQNNCFWLNMHKIALFLLENLPSLGAPAPDPLVSGLRRLWELCHQTLQETTTGDPPQPPLPLTNPGHTTDQSIRFLQPQIVWNGIFLLLQIALFLSVPGHVREGCGGSSSRLGRHTSRSANSPKRFHPKSLM